MTTFSEEKRLKLTSRFFCRMTEMRRQWIYAAGSTHITSDGGARGLVYAGCCAAGVTMLFINGSHCGGFLFVF